MSGKQEARSPRVDPVDHGDMPPKSMSTANLASEQRGVPSFEIAFVDSLAAVRRPRRTLMLELQEEFDTVEPGADSREADAPFAQWRDVLDTIDAPRNAAGSSVAPVAMHADSQPEPRIERRNVVHAAAYAVLLGAMCLAAVGFYRGGGFESSTWQVSADGARATSPVHRVLAAAPIDILSAVAVPSGVLEPAVLDGTRVDAALEAAWSRANACTPPDDRGTRVTVNVVLAPSGQVTTARVAGAPYEGTPTGDCIASAFRSMVTAAFQGQSVVMNRSYIVR